MKRGQLWHRATALFSATVMSALSVHCEFSSPNVAHRSGTFVGEQALADELDTRLDKNTLLLVGESAHGVREFMILRGRLLQQAVERHGYTVLAIEASSSRAEALDRYVLDGEGDPVAVIRDLGYWMWDNREFLEIVQWMRSHNALADTKAKLRVVGIDPQLPAKSAEQLAAFLERASPSILLENREILDEIIKNGDAGASRFNRAIAEKAVTLTGDLLDDVTRRHHEKSADAEAARRHARALHMNARLFAAHRTPDAVAVRESLLAENVLHTRENLAGKIVVWAHNEHIKKTPGHLGSILSARQPTTVVGLTFFQGSLLAFDKLARRLRTYTAASPPADTIERQLGDLGHEGVVTVDLQEGNSAAFFSSAKRMRMIGAQYNEWSEFQRIDLVTAYDLLVLIPVATPPTAVESGKTFAPEAVK